MKRVFRAEKMLARLEREGRMDMVDEKTREFIMMLDGKEGTDYNYQSVVNDEPLVWIEADKDQSGTYVNIEDCD